MSWQPILEPSAAAASCAIVRDIATALAGFAYPHHELLFWTYLASSPLDDDFVQRQHERALKRFVMKLEAGIDSPALFGIGLAGFGWVAAHAVDEADELLAIVDRTLLGMLAVPEWKAPYDLILGLVGYGVYFLERGSEPGMRLVVDHLARLARRDGERAWWFTPPEQLPDHQRELSPNGYINCGMAHGVPAVIAMLSRHLERTPNDGAARELRDGAIAWLLAQRDADGFPSQLDERPRVRSRTAWCYGDPGVLTALWHAAPSTALADDMLAALSRSPAEAVVHDAELCHGAAGLGHLANRWFHATGDVRFRDHARRWLAHAIELRVPGVGVGGYRSYQGGEWLDSNTFLDGAMGIALALLSAATGLEPNWDRLLLVDLPIREH